MVINGRFPIPDTIPFLFVAFVLQIGRNKAVPPCSQRVDLKIIAVALIVKGVQGHTNRVFGTQKYVPLHFFGHDALRFGIVSPDADIKKI